MAEEEIESQEQSATTAPQEATRATSPLENEIIAIQKKAHEEGLDDEVKRNEISRLGDKYGIDQARLWAIADGPVVKRAIYESRGHMYDPGSAGDYGENVGKITVAQKLEATRKSVAANKLTPAKIDEFFKSEGSNPAIPGNSYDKAYRAQMEKDEAGKLEATIADLHRQNSPTLNDAQNNGILNLGNMETPSADVSPEPPSDPSGSSQNQ